jgi:hypothetical protein
MKGKRIFPHCLGLRLDFCEFISDSRTLAEISPTNGEKSYFYKNIGKNVQIEDYLKMG